VQFGGALAAGRGKCRVYTARSHAGRPGPQPLWRERGGLGAQLELAVSLGLSFSLQCLNHHERNHDLASVALHDMAGQATDAIRR
jgi:hypothetical protein